MTSNALISEYERDPNARVHSTQDLIQLLKSLSLNDPAREHFLDGTDLAPSNLNDTALRVSFNQKLQVFRNVHQNCLDQAIALKAGSLCQFSDFGFFGYALISSETMKEAISLGFKYLRLAGPVLRKKFYVEDNKGIFEGFDLQELDELLPFCTEYWFSSINALGSDILGRPFPNTLLRLPYPDPGYADVYQRVFNCPVEFNADSIQWLFDASILAEPVRHANPMTVKLCIQSCDELLSTMESPSGLSQKIAGMLLESTGQFPSIEAVAAQLNVSSRQLRRQLDKEGSSYRTILDEVRSDLSCQLLSQTELTVDEISDRIGFTETSNFRAAFKKWRGITPNQYRSEHR